MRKILIFNNMQDKLMFKVNLHLNKNLFTEDYFFYDPLLSSKDNSLPQQNCYYHGNVEGFSNSFVAISNCHGYHGMIIIDEDILKFSLHTLEDGKFVLREEHTPSPFNGFPSFPSNSSAPFHFFDRLQLKPGSIFPTLRTPLPSSNFATTPIPRKIQSENPDQSQQRTNQNLIYSSPNVDPNMDIKNAKDPPFDLTAGVIHILVPLSSDLNPDHKVVNSPLMKQHPQTYTGYPQYAQDQSHRPSYDSHFPAPSHVDNARPSSGAPFAKNFPVDYHAQSQGSEPLFSDISTVLEFLNIVNSHFSQTSSNKNREHPNVSYSQQSPSSSAFYGPSNSPTKYHHQTNGGNMLLKRHPDDLKQPLQKLRSSSKRHSKPHLKKRNTYGSYLTPYLVTYYYKVFIGLKLDANLSNPKFGEHLIGDYINLAQYYYQRYSFNGYQIKLSGAHLLPLNVVPSLLDINIGNEDVIILKKWKEYGLKNSFLSQSDVAYLFTVDQRDVFPRENQRVSSREGLAFIGRCIANTSFSIGTITPLEPHNLYTHVSVLVHEIGHNLGIDHAPKDTGAYSDGSMMSTRGGMFWKWKPYAYQSLKDLTCHPRSYQYGSF